MINIKSGKHIWQVPFYENDFEEDNDTSESDDDSENNEEDNVKLAHQKKKYREIKKIE